MSFNPRQDPELEFLKDRELLDLASVLRTRRLPEPPLDPAFKSSLRRQLRQQHWETLQTSQPWWRRLTSGPGLAWSGAFAGAVMIAAAVFFAGHPGGSSNVALVTSPLDHLRNVAVVQPMEIHFAQAMDHQSVQSALNIEPATQVTYTWQGNTLLVQPAAGQLAPNTQYRLTLGSTATSTAGTPLGKKTTIVFVTAPPAPPTPSASPTPQATGIGLGTPAQLAPALGGVTPAWSPDGSTVYFAAADDSLQSLPAAGGNPRSLGVQAVSGIAAAPDSSAVAALAADAVTVVNADGSSPHRYQAAGGLAIAWDGQRVLIATPTGVIEVKGSATEAAHPLVSFASPPQSAAFAPDGKRLLYLDATGQVHLVDINAAKDTSWQIATAGLPAWSQDGRQVAFATLQGVETAAPDGTGASVLATLDQLGVHTTDGIALAWSGGAVIAATPAGLTGIDATLRAPVQLASGAFAAPAASPDRLGLAYVENGSLYVAPLQRPGIQEQQLTAAEAVLQPFMDARKQGDSTDAGKYLDAAGQQAYAKGGLLFGGQLQVARWFPVLVQAHGDGTVTALVRIVLEDGHHVEQSQLDETITLLSGADGTVQVHGVTATSPRPVDGGPELIGIQVSRGLLTLQFDSDLDPATLAGIGLAGPDGTPVAVTPGYSKRTVTIDLSSVSAGTLLQLSIGSSLKDVEGRGAAQPIVIPIQVPSSAS